jgi:aspartate carbamoyltransferase regulatory subunit
MEEKNTWDDTLTEDRFSLRRLGDLLLHNVSVLKVQPEVISLYSQNPRDSDSLSYLRRYMGLKYLFRRFLRKHPVVRVTSNPDTAEFSFDLGYFLKVGRMPVKLPPLPESGKEQYIPSTEKRILGYIAHGTTIDRIPVGMVWNLIDPLGLNRFPGRVSIGDNYWSRRVERKGIIKIEGHELDSREREVVGVYAPKSTISLISAGRVYRKFQAETPEFLDGIISCPSPDCRRDVIHYSSPERRFTCNSCGLNFDLEGLIRGLGLNSPTKPADYDDMK